MNFFRSETIAELTSALAKAQGEMKGADKDSVNPHYKQKYADLASVWDACREPLSKHGLSVIQLPVADHAQVCVTTLLAHTSGEHIGCELTMSAQQNTPQSIGSAITYARRYSLMAIAGIAPEDDDGNAASHQRNTPEQQKEFAQQRIQQERAKMQSQEPPDLDVLADEKRQLQAQEMRQAKEQPDAEIPPAASTLLQSFAAMSRFDRIKAFKPFKADLAKWTGDDQCYYQILGRHGVEHADQFKSIAQAKRCLLDLWKALQGAQPPNPLEISAADIVGEPA